MSSKKNINRTSYGPVVGALVAAAAGQWCFRVAMAEWAAFGGTAAGLRAATGWMDREAAHWCRLAEAEERDEAALGALRRCTAANPSWGMAWTSQGMLEDAMGRNGEGALLEGARRNRRYGAYRAASDHYFGRGEWGKFEEWAWGAMEMGTRAERIELLEMLLGTPGGAQRDLVRAAKGSPSTLAAVLELAMGRGWDDTAHTCAKLLTAVEWAGIRGQFEEWILGRGRGDLLGGEGRIQNETFVPWPGGKGWDWRIVGGEGVETGPGEAGGVRIVLTGQQAESVPILWAYVDLRGERTLETTASAGGLEGDSGLRWRLEDVKTGRVVWEGAEDLRGSQTVKIETKQWAGTGRLVFGYRRKKGTIRSKGEIVLKRVWLR